MGGGRRTAGEAGVRRDAVMTPQRGIRERGPPPRQRGWGGGDEADLGASAPYSRRSRTAARFAGRDPSPAAAGPPRRRAGILCPRIGSCVGVWPKKEWPTCQPRSSSSPTTMGRALYRSGPTWMGLTWNPTVQKRRHLQLDGNGGRPEKTLAKTFAASMAVSSTLRRARAHPSWAAAARGLLATWGAGSGGRVRHPRHGAASASLFSSLSSSQTSAADAQLLRVINMEISYAQKDCKNRNWVFTTHLIPH